MAVIEEVSSGSRPRRASVAQHLQVATSRLRLFLAKHTSYFALHLSYLIILSLVGGITIYAIQPFDGNVRVTFIDSLFKSVSAACVTGLQTLDVSSLAVGSQVVMALLILLGSSVLMSSVPALLRRAYWQRAARQAHSEHEADVLAAATEYRALGWVAGVAITYYIVWQAVVGTLWALYLSFHEPARSRLQPGVSPVWYAYFLSFASFNNAGFVVSSDNLMRFVDDYVILLPAAVLILAGNTAYPLLFRGIIAGLHRATGGTDSALRFLLDRPRKCFTHMFRHEQTLRIGAVLVLFTLLEFAVFLGLDFHSPVLSRLPAHVRALAAFFSAVSTRTAGFNVVNPAEMSAGALLVTLMMMYVSSVPFILAVRKSRERHAKPNGGRLRTSAYTHTGGLRLDAAAVVNDHDGGSHSGARPLRAPIPSFGGDGRLAAVCEAIEDDVGSGVPHSDSERDLPDSAGVSASPPEGAAAAGTAAATPQKCTGPPDASPSPALSLLPGTVYNTSAITTTSARDVDLEMAVLGDSVLAGRGASALPAAPLTPPRALTFALEPTPVPMPRLDLPPHSHLFFGGSATARDGIGHCDSFISTGGESFIEMSWGRAVPPLPPITTSVYEHGVGSSIVAGADEDGEGPPTPGSSVYGDGHEGVFRSRASSLQDDGAPRDRRGEMGRSGGAARHPAGEPVTTTGLALSIVSRDLLWLFFALWCICVAEDVHLMDLPKISVDVPAAEITATSVTAARTFSVFGVCFEIVSGFGTVGLSLGYPGSALSLSCQFTVFSKVVLMVVMLAGRHRGLPYSIDPSIHLPTLLHVDVRVSGTITGSTGDMEGSGKATAVEDGLGSAESSAAASACEGGSARGSTDVPPHAVGLPAAAAPVLASLPRTADSYSSHAAWEFAEGDVASLRTQRGSAREPSSRQGSARGERAPGRQVSFRTNSALPGPQRVSTSSSGEGGGALGYASAVHAPRLPLREGAWEGARETGSPVSDEQAALDRAQANPSELPEALVGVATKALEAAQNTLRRLGASQRPRAFGAGGVAWTTSEGSSAAAGERALAAGSQAASLSASAASPRPQGQQLQRQRPGSGTPRGKASNIEPSPQYEP